MFSLPPRRRTREAALRDLGSPDPRVRVSALSDLAAALDESDGEGLSRIGKLLSDPHPRVRAEAAERLGGLKASGFVPDLLVCIEDPHPYVRQMAICALGELGDDRARPRLVRALSDPRPEVRYQSVMALMRMGGQEADLARDKGLADDDASIVYIALRLLEEIPALREGVDLADKLLHACPEVRVMAALLSSEEGAMNILSDVATFRLRTREVEDEQAAVERIGELGLVALIPALERRAFGRLNFFRETCAFSAKIALARMGHARAEAALMRHLEAKDPSEREAAVVAVGRARMGSARERVIALGREGHVSEHVVTSTLRLLDEATRPSRGE